MDKGIVTFSELIKKDRIFQVPLYQRNYSWDSNQLEDFWEDLFYLNPSKKHYFGTVLLKNAGEEKKRLNTFEIYDIIDGQQRITTALILLRVMLSSLEEKGYEKERDIKKQEEDYLKSDTIYKLKLLGDDEAFFRDYVVDDKEYPDETLTPSQSRLKNAKEFFKAKFDKLYEDNPDEFGEKVFNLKRKVDNLEIIRYPVDNNADAARIFEVVNDRGKQLTKLEKTKSFLMQMIYLSESETDKTEDHLKKVNEKFSSIFKEFETIRNTESGEYIEEDDIQRYHYVMYVTDSQGGKNKGQNYLEKLKSKIRKLYKEDNNKCVGYIIDYAEDLERAFIALREIITYCGKDEIKKYLDKIFRLNVKAPFYPFLIANWIRFKDNSKRMEEFLRLVEIYLFRVYSIGKRRSDTGKSRLYDLAYKIYNDKIPPKEAGARLIKYVEEYQNDSYFEENLKGSDFYKRVSNPNKKNLLLEYEKYLNEKAKERMNISSSDILSDDYTIDHIWARDSTRLGLDKSTAEVHEEYKHRLGNLTLASRSWNTTWGNSPYEVKKEHYKDSSLRVQRDLPKKYSSWGKEQIESREKEIIEFALKRWRKPSHLPNL